MLISLVEERARITETVTQHPLLAQSNQEAVSAVTNDGKEARQSQTTSTLSSDFLWTEEAKAAFRQMKEHIAKLPMLTTPEEQEELIVYLAASKEAVSVVLMTEKEDRQMPIYFVSRALRGPEVNYTPMKKVWSIQLGEFGIHYRPRVFVKGQVLAEFIVERPEEEGRDDSVKQEEPLPAQWTLFMDGSSCVDGCGAGVILTDPKGVEFTYALIFQFEATNKEAEY
ncbi:reverse transcriptase domain-containing protein [Tanacetum coccineum]